MKQSKLVVALLAVLFTSSVITSCRQGGAGTSAGNDSTKVEVDSASLPELKGDASINKATKFYAGISKEGINMSATDAESWDKYSKEINRLLTISKTTRVLVDSLVKTDFADFRDKIDMVFYPFSGADFLYPITIFPNADTYVLCGLEKIGTPINTDINTFF